MNWTPPPLNALEPTPNGNQLLATKDFMNARVSGGTLLFEIDFAKRQVVRAFSRFQMAKMS